MSIARYRLCFVACAFVTAALVALDFGSFIYAAFATGPLGGQRFYYWSIRSGVVRAVVARQALKYPAFHYPQIARFNDYSRTSRFQAVEFRLLECSADYESARAPSIKVPLWVLPSLTSIPTFAWGVLAFRQGRHVIGCRECGYDLTGAPSPTCPECGKPAA